MHSDFNLYDDDGDGDEKEGIIRGDPLCFYLYLALHSNLELVQRVLYKLHSMRFRKRTGMDFWWVDVVTFSFIRAYHIS